MNNRHFAFAALITAIALPACSSFDPLHAGYWGSTSQTIQIATPSASTRSAAISDQWTLERTSGASALVRLRRTPEANASALCLVDGEERNGNVAFAAGQTCSMNGLSLTLTAGTATPNASNGSLSGSLAWTFTGTIDGEASSGTITETFGGGVPQ